MIVLRGNPKEEVLNEQIPNFPGVFGQSADVIAERIQNGLSKSTVVVRLNDCGDIASYNEMVAWYQVAVNNPGILFYGYTKATPYVYKLRRDFGPLPSNLVWNMSTTDNPTSQAFRDKIDHLYPNEFNTCHIVESVEMHVELSELPFNNEEEMAMVGTSDFLIGLHGTFEKGSKEYETSQYFEQYAIDNNVKVC